jgi:hypothetical protein
LRSVIAAVRSSASGEPRISSRLETVRWLITEHEEHRRLHANERTASTECVFCDVIHRATALLLEGTVAATMDVPVSRLTPSSASARSPAPLGVNSIRLPRPAFHGAHVPPSQLRCAVPRAQIAARRTPTVAPAQSPDRTDFHGRP